MNLEQCIEDTVIDNTVFEAIKEVERKSTALSFDPENLYKQFQKHSAYKEQDQYRGVIK